VYRSISDVVWPIRETPALWADLREVAVMKIIRPPRVLLAIPSMGETEATDSE